MSSNLTNRGTLQSSSGGVWSYISASRLNLWLRCGLAFKLRYIEGVPTPTTPSPFVGKLCHSGLEAFYRHGQLGITLGADEIGRRLLANWEPAVAEEGMSFQSPDEAATLQKQAVDLVTAYLNYVPKDEPNPWQWRLPSRARW